MYRFSERPSKGGPEDLAVSLDGYYVSTAHDVAFPQDLKTRLGASAPQAEDPSFDLEAGTDGQDGDSEAHDRPSSWRCTWMLRRSKANDQASVHDHPESEAANATLTPGGFGITFEEVVKVRSLEALIRYHGVEGLSTRLGTDLERGIDRRDDEILQRTEAFGSNACPFKKDKRFWSFIWKASKFPPSLVMIVAAVINFLLRIKRKAVHDGSYVGACAILATFLDIIVRAITDYKQSRQFQKLSEEKRNVTLEVIRGGETVSVSTYDVVVGDIVPLKNGDQVPADGVLFVANSLKIDEQEITGSHVIVEKDLPKDPFLLSRSKVIEGTGTMLVTSVGVNTQWGLKIEIPHESDEEKPFQAYLNWLATITSWVVVWFASVACIVQLCRYFSGWTKKPDGTPMFILGSTSADEVADFVIKSLEFGIATILVTVPVGLSMSVLLNIASTTIKMMSDNAWEPRPSTQSAIKMCESGGVKVCIMTNDDVRTAEAIAKDCGITVGLSGHNTMTGAQFRELSDLYREQIAGNIRVYAQSSPSDRLLLVEALKKGGHVFAAIGMGIDDPTTLLAADVSIAMGIGGTAAAKKNSNIIILDDKFATVVKVIQWCRSLYTNIQRYVLFRLTVSVSTLAICVVEVVIYNEFPFIAVQLLLLNLIVDIFGALALAYKPTDQYHLMGKPPLGIRDPLVNKMMWIRLIMQVIYLVLFPMLLNSGNILKLELGYTGNGEKARNTFIFSSSVFYLIIVFEFMGIFVSAIKLDLKAWMLFIFVELLRSAIDAS
ncbi:unnamed protein product [Thlaspi arvense]|uniref:Cation-transporting P-type ATPase N-terminal domain-containing protein n=1 Tax=Thlaspi arvense TaxID=13288 RepID=A0AAU9SSC3_THLAR|nr:unnamed protein product [Thlaspi arvense]